MSAVARALDRHLLTLCAVVLLAAGLRLYGLDWDAGQHQHPDERHISDVLVSRLAVPPRQSLAELFDPGVSQLNPRSNDPQTGRPRQFAYGSLPLLLTDAVACAMDRLSGNGCHPDDPGPRYWTTYEHQYLVGRFLTVLADLALIVVSYLLARRAFGAMAGLVAALFLAVSVIHIQLAHFFATDTWSALFAMAALWALYRAADDGPFASWRAWALAGVMAGASVASKANTIGLVVPALVALWYSVRGEASDWLPLSLRRAAVLGVATLLAFAVLEPYALPALGVYLRDLNEQAAILGSGAVDVPYTRQFVGTLPVWHYLWNLWGYGLGAGLTLLGLAGLAASAWRAWRRRSAIDLMLLAWFLAYGLLITTVFAKFLRYTLPLVPVLAILAGAVAARALTWASALGRRGAEEQGSGGAAGWAGLSRWLEGRIAAPGLLRPAAPLLLRSAVVLLLLAGLLQALAFATIYAQPHTRVAASAWIYANVPAGARLAAETWDDALPLPFPDGRNPGARRYRFVEANHYHDRAPEEGLRDLARILRESDYIVLASQRVYGSTDRLPWRYPLVNRYYDLLFAERLGFELVYRNELQPRLGPFHLDSRWADESFSVYDHPPVRIYQKRATLSDEHLRALFAEALERTPVVGRTPPKEKSLLLTEPLWTWPDLSGEAWARPAGSSWAGLALWLLALAALALVGLPWALLLFRPLADGGVGLALSLGLLAVAYLAWIGASLRWTLFSAGTVQVVALLVGLAGWLLLTRRPGALAELRARRPAVLTSAGVFAVAFTIALLLRLANPDLWQPWLGGEKPMEGAFLNAILRSAYFPPYDPWFSGGYINYYYFGFVLVAIPIKLAGVAPAIGFNLAVATLYGMVAAGLCSLGQTLARALAGRDRPPAPGLVSGIGVVAPVLMLGIGNLDGFVQVVQRLTGTLERFDFWRSSRAIQFVITEFPYFSFLFADLHAHVMAMPLATLVLGAALALVLAEKSPVGSGQPAVRGGPAPAPDGWWLALGDWRLVAGRLALAGLALGGLAATNAWDVPAYTGVVAGASFIAAPFVRGAIFRRAGWAALAAALAIGLAYLLYLPFFQGFQSFYSSLGLTRIPSRLGEFLNVWGYLLALVAVLVAVLLTAFVRAGGLRRLTWPVVALVLATALATGAVIPRGLPGPALVLPLIGLLALLWLANGLAPAGELTLMLLIGGLCIIAGVEFVYIVDFLQGGEWYRMNTVFKLYLEAWLLLSLGLAGGVALVAREWRALGPTLRGIAATVAIGGLLASLAYPVFITPDRLRQRFDATPGPTLDGLAYMEVGILHDPRGAAIRLDEDLAAITWMQANLRGAPVVAEAMIGPYRGNGSRIANATGFPTVLGWDNHEGQQRWPELIGPRSRDVRALYTSRAPEQVLALIERYDIDYIMVGQIERLTTLNQGHLGATRTGERYASPEGLATLEALARAGALAEAFRQGETVLYRVVRPLFFPGDQAVGAPAMAGPALTGAIHE